MEILHLYFVLGAASMATLGTAEDLKIDFSCHPDYNAETLTSMKDECTIKMQSPLKRPCVEACVLNDLGLLRKAFNQTKTNRKGYDGGGNDGNTPVSTELEDLLSENQALADAVQRSVEEKCGETMQTLAKEKTCEQWDPIYTCVKDAICAASIKKLENIYPDLSCHTGYKSGPVREDHEHCIQDIAHPMNKNCYKACMLNKFGIFEFNMNIVGKPISKLGDIGNEEDGYYGVLVGNLQWRLKDNDQLGLDLAKKVIKKCEEIFKKIVVEEKKPCDEWDPLYDCVTEALACK